MNPFEKDPDFKKFVQSLQPLSLKRQAVERSIITKDNRQFTVRLSPPEDSGESLAWLNLDVYDYEDTHVVTGNLRFDGCANLTFYPDDDGENHFCGSGSVRSLGEALDVCFKIAKMEFGFDD